MRNVLAVMLETGVRVLCTLCKCSPSGLRLQPLVFEVGMTVLPWTKISRWEMVRALRFDNQTMEKGVLKIVISLVSSCWKTLISTRHLVCRCVLVTCQVTSQDHQSWDKGGSLEEGPHLDRHGFVLHTTFPLFKPTFSGSTLKMRRWSRGSLDPFISSSSACSHWVPLLSWLATYLLACILRLPRGTKSDSCTPTIQ